MKLILVNILRYFQDDSSYKNLLQELAQKECSRLPTYSTIKSGEAHIPTFVSTVDVEGELFTGQEMKTKKQAELSAAKAAYTLYNSFSIYKYFIHVHKVFIFFHGYLVFKFTLPYCHNSNNIKNCSFHRPVFFFFFFFFVIFSICPKL